MTALEDTRLTLGLDHKSVQEDGSFSGYGSIFAETDLGRDQVQAGAFRKSLMLRPAQKVRMLREHNPREPIGVWTEIVEDAKGLRVSGRLVLDTVAGRETHALLKAGAMDTLSIGYRTKSARFDKSTGVRLLDEIDLHEISIVTFGMLPSATITSVKSTQFAELVAAINAARSSL
ncbi:primosomal replication protein N [Camelimonas fluminis]|uniref:HK97 family phage prohead protease n=1 Tax=Camelimonas fluminis TaxID=1576911 RepID=A0ABV7UGM6_9HYPH|nr:HK97 family phage prohead protease [Camelimonas fluminis]GHE49950.1 primosomal replication protein N [Camelimonas fluminis]